MRMRNFHIMWHLHVMMSFHFVGHFHIEWRHFHVHWRHLSFCRHLIHLALMLLDIAFGQFQCFGHQVHAVVREGWWHVQRWGHFKDAVVVHDLGSEVADAPG